MHKANKRDLFVKIYIIKKILLKSIYTHVHNIQWNEQA